MLEAPILHHGVMEGQGSYNRNSRIQATGMQLALPLLEKAARNVALDDGHQPVVVADYGSSQGKNSLTPMRIAIRTLQQSIDPDRPILVFHIDQPANDFNTLFAVLGADPDRYALDESNVFPCAIGKSFYEQVLPANYVDLAWCSYAAMWLSRIPTLIPGHFIAHRCTGTERAVFDRQAAEDWRAFLSLRARELRTGGRLVVVLPGLNDDGVSGLEQLFDHANKALADMVDAGEIQAEERAQMVLGVHPQRRRDLLAPFVPCGQFQGLRVERCEVTSVPDSAWADYERDSKVDALVTKQALFMRSAFISSLSLALTNAHEAEQCRVFADKFENRVKQRLLNQPMPFHSVVQTLVLAKEACACATQNQE